MVQRALDKLGLRRDIDLALHLPLRYEDETRITRLADARDGDVVQIEGVVTHCDVSYRPRRQLLVVLQDDGDGDTCTLRFFNFYPSQQKQLAVGNRIRARGEIRGGLVGWTMMHPSCKTAGGDLPVALTPVYSTVAGLPQPGTMVRPSEAWLLFMSVNPLAVKPSSANVEMPSSLSSLDQTSMRAS